MNSSNQTANKQGVLRMKIKLVIDLNIDGNRNLGLNKEEWDAMTEQDKCSYLDDFLAHIIDQEASVGYEVFSDDDFDEEWEE